MKSILVAVLLIITIILLDYLSLLQQKPNYPDEINRLIQAINQGDVNLLKQPPPSAVEIPVTEPPVKKLYQWRADDGVWQITDKPPPNHIFQTINLAEPQLAPTNEPDSIPESSPEPTEQQLKQASQCQFYLDQIDYYKEKMRFGGPGHVIDHWQRQIDWYKKLALQSCTGQ